MFSDQLKNIKINGRYLCKDNYLYFYNVGSGISVLSKDTKITITLSFLNNSGYIYIIKNKEYNLKEKVFIDKETELVISVNKPDTQIDICKANEALDNTLVIKDIIGDFKKPQDSKWNIKIYGDSTITGYGILGKYGDEISLHMSDGVEDFCFDALYSLDCDFNIFAASGWGLVFSSYTTPKTIGIIDKCSFVSVTNSEVWKDDKKNDLLIISLGTNDYSFIKENAEIRAELFDRYFQAYEKLILQERNDNQNLPVLMVYGTLNESECYELNEYTFNKLKEKYNFIYLHKFNGNASAISNHAYITAHKKMKKELEICIKRILKI